jgi:hypothetical protein
MIELGTAISEPVTSGASAGVLPHSSIIAVTWKPLLQVLALVLLRCNQLEMVRPSFDRVSASSCIMKLLTCVYRHRCYQVQTVTAVCIRLANATALGGAALLPARNAVFGSLVREPARLAWKFTVQNSHKIVAKFTAQAGST